MTHPPSLVLAMQCQLGWRRTLCLCSGAVLPCIQGCNKLFSSNSPKAEMNIPQESIQMLCRAAATGQAACPATAAHGVPTRRNLHPSCPCPTCTLDGWDLSTLWEMLSQRCFPIWMSSFAGFPCISYAMSICCHSGLLIRVSGRGRSNGLQEPKYITATLLCLCTKFMISTKN